MSSTKQAIQDVVMIARNGIDRVIELERENKRLTDALIKANAQAEHFEREWYLRGDEIERLRGLSDLTAEDRDVFGSRSVELFSVRDNLVEADTTGNIYPNAEAVAFSEAVAAAIKAKLVAGAPKFGLMPYRYNGDYLGFDWIDAEKNSISIVFYTTPNAQPLPTCIDPEGADVGVSSWIDALLLIRMIAERVKGDSIGDV